MQTMTRAMRTSLIALLILVLATLAASVAFRGNGRVQPNVGMGEDRAAFFAVSAATGTAFDLTIRRPGEFEPGARRMTFLLSLLGAGVTMMISGLAIGRAFDRRVTPGLVMLTMACVILPVTLIGWTVSGSPRLALACITGFGTFAGGERLTLGPAFAILYLPLMLLGTLGPGVWIGIGHARGRRIAWAALAWTCGLWAIATLCLSILTWRETEGVMNAGPVTSIFAESAAVSADARWTGLEPTDLAAMPRTARWLLMVLMVIGGNVGTCGVGVMALAAWTRTARPMPMKLKGLVAAWAGWWVLCATAGVGYLFSAATQLNFEQASMLAVSATSNIGLSPEAISMTGSGLGALVHIAAVSRLGQLILLIVWIGMSDVKALNHDRRISARSQ